MLCIRRILTNTHIYIETAQCRYSNDFSVTWGHKNMRSLYTDHVWQMALNNVTASGFASKRRYLFGSFSMNIKLVPGDSAGTVTAYYFSSQTTHWDELDFEFLGNETGHPYILQTNVFWNGTGGREQRMYLWFDPTASYHNYSILWNPKQIIFMVDGVPIRVVTNHEDKGIPFLSKQPMGIYASIWDGSAWATRSGLVKIDWSRAPFVASFAKYKFDACSPSRSSTCPKMRWWNTPPFQSLTAHQQYQLQWVKKFYMTYNYCTDRRRYPVPLLECTL